MSIEIVYQVREDATGEDIASFPAGIDSDAKSWLAQLGARDMCRGLNDADAAAGGCGWAFTVVRGYLIRDHRLPVFRNVVI